MSDLEPINEIYNREQQLRSRLNTFLHERFALPEHDYYADLDANSLAELKSVLGDINNIFTLKVTFGFIRWLENALNLDRKDCERIEAAILSTKPNSNGYDIEISEPYKIIAEVKCNVPINGGSIYGSAQRNGLKKDIEALVSGKGTSKANVADYLKFLVLLDTPNVRQATDHFFRNYPQYADRIVVEPQSVDNAQNIYVVFVDPDR
jgi:hypothetical protein